MSPETIIPQSCQKCKAEAPPGAVFCPFCGTKLGARTQNRKKRGNGTGSVYKLPNGSWAAVRVIGYTVTPDGKLHKKKVGKYSFKTKRDAVNGLANLEAQPRRPKTMTFLQLYDTWEPTHKVGRDTMNCYRSAKKWFSPVWNLPINEIDIDDLQECVSECPRGKRTRENMKALCGLLYKYAIPRHLATLNLAEYLKVGGGKQGEKEALPMEAVRRLSALIGAVPFADYIVAQCHLGFRPAELLALSVDDYDREGRFFRGGAKTDAGRNRIVPVADCIQPIIDRLCARSAGPVFPDESGGYMSTPVYRSRFYAALEAAGIDNPVTIVDGINRRRYTPHSCRHTFATMMKNVDGADKDKLALIGHTSTEMLRHYQEADVESMRKIVNAMGQ